MDVDDEEEVVPTAFWPSTNAEDEDVKWDGNVQASAGGSFLHAPEPGTNAISEDLSMASEFSVTESEALVSEDSFLSTLSHSMGPTLSQRTEAVTRTPPIQSYFSTETQQRIAAHSSETRHNSHLPNATMIAATYTTVTQRNSESQRVTATNGLLSDEIRREIARLSSDLIVERIQRQRDEICRQRQSQGEIESESHLQQTETVPMTGSRNGALPLFGHSTEAELLATTTTTSRSVEDEGSESESEDEVLSDDEFLRMQTAFFSRQTTREPRTNVFLSQSTAQHFRHALMDEMLASGRQSDVEAAAEILECELAATSLTSGTVLDETQTEGSHSVDSHS